MINLSDRIPAHYSQRARTELSAAWEHLLTAAQETARQVGDTSRTRGSMARERAQLARLALRGQLPTSQWRWAGAGLAAGVVIGAAAAAILTRRPRPTGPDASQQPDDEPSPALDEANAVGAAAGREPAAES
jgi:hypothetical protein